MQTTNGFIIPRPSDQGSDQGPKKGAERSLRLGEDCTHCPVRCAAWLEDSTVW